MNTHTPAGLVQGVVPTSVAVHNPEWDQKIRAYQGMATYGSPYAVTRASIAVFERPLNGEDMLVVKPEVGLYGVLDGAGGVRNSGERVARDAAHIGSRVLYNSFTTNYYSSSQEAAATMHDALQYTSNEIAQKTPGITTATLAQIAFINMVPHVIVGSRGDSLALADNASAKRNIQAVEQELSDAEANDWPITYRIMLREQLDDHIGDGALRHAVNTIPQTGAGAIDSWLGSEANGPSKPSVVRIAPLRDRQSLDLVTDGITGDRPDEWIHPPTMKRIIHDPNPLQAAAAYLKHSKKIDDKSGVVLRLQTTSR